MKQFDGIYFPGFITQNVDLNNELVRILKRYYRSRGFRIVEGELSRWPIRDRFRTLNFAGQTALVISGELVLEPTSKSGMKTVIREAFDPYGRRSIQEGRRYVTEEGWLLSGALFFLDHDKPMFNIPIRVQTAQNRSIGPITVLEAVSHFSDSDVIPSIDRVIFPYFTRTERELVWRP